MKIKSCICTLFAGSVFLFSGCGPTTEELVRSYNQDLLTGNFDNTMPYVEKALLDDEDNSHEDTPLFRLMSAGAKLHKGAFQEALKEFEKAEDVCLDNDGKTPNHATAMSVNDQYYVFEPGLQDRMFISLYKALLFGSTGQKNAMRTEFNRMMQYQENWLHKQRERIADAEKARRESIDNEQEDVPDNVAAKQRQMRSETDSNLNTMLSNDGFVNTLTDNTGVNIRRDGNIDNLTPEDYQNAYATHLCGVFRWLNKDNGTYYLRDAARLNPHNRVLVKDLAEARDSVIPQNEVWIYVEDGLCTCRDEVRLDLPMALIPGLNRYVLYAGIALPKLVERNTAASVYQANGVPLELLENIDRLRKIEFSIYMRSAIPREITRCLLKVLPQVAAGVVANNSSNDAVRWSCLAFQVSYAGYAAASTQADCRSWGALPKRVLVVRMKRPDDGVIDLTADDQKLQINVPAGNNIVWVRKAAPTAPFIVQMINFAD